MKFEEYFEKLECEYGKNIKKTNVTQNKKEDQDNE